MAVPQGPGMNASSDSSPGHIAGAADRSPPFRFYDNRRKYLAFVTSCNEKSANARRTAHEASPSRTHTKVAPALLELAHI